MTAGGNAAGHLHLEILFALDIGLKARISGSDSKLQQLATFKLLLDFLSARSIV